MHADRAQIGVNAELFAQAEQALLGSLLRIGIVPPRTTHCAQQYRVRRSTDVERLARQRSSASVESAASNQTVTQLEAVAKTLTDGLKNAHAFCDHLRTDPVAGENGDFHRVDTRAGCEDS